jgi:hypothetical protein
VLDAVRGMSGEDGGVSHAVKVNLDHAPGGWLARCSCGWEAKRPCWYQARAKRFAKVHLEALR